MFKLISDTSCDWIKEYAEEHNVTLVPLYTTFDGQTYYKDIEAEFCKELITVILASG